MVSGNFKCIGTPQHIKSKYGKGFEIEVKIKNIKKEEIEEVRNVNHIEGYTVDPMELGPLLSTLQASETTRRQISKDGAGSYIWNDLSTNNRCSINEIIEFYMIQARMERVQYMLDNALQGIEII
jgi:hypothetical protein